jgi:hypothetical protein
LVVRLRAAAAVALGGPPDLWHFHNHALGKSRVLADAVAELAESGERVVLQLHDLVEDGRSGNYARLAGCLRLYPVGPRIRYLFVNSREMRRFDQAGMPVANRRFLPNVVVSNPSPMGADAKKTADRWVVYPVRGIRRKNLGELVLLAALAPAGVKFAVTAAPVAADALEIHDAWRAFAAEMGLPVEFAVVDRLAPAAGEDSSLEAWLANASQWVTTSVAEGFGFAFLDALARGKPLIGRNLPHLADDWAAAGVRLGGLYDRIVLPVSAINLRTLEIALRDAIQAAYRGYGRDVTQADFARAWTALVADGWLDFGNLPEDLQRSLIARWLTEPGGFELWVEVGGERVPAAAWLAEQLQEREPLAINLEPWSEAVYQQGLLAVYTELMEETAAGVSDLNPARVLEACLTPEAFHFLLG